MASLPPAEALTLAYDWEVFARDAQLPPPGRWTTWLILAGRGFGKTRSGAEWVRDRVTTGQARRIALVGATAADVRDTMVEGESGLLAIAPPWDRPRYEPSKRRLTWPNGALATCFSADEPERLRGPQHDTSWSDELGAWRFQRDAWDQLQFGMRLGDPRNLVTTTPRTTPVLRELLKDARGDDPMTVVSRGSTHENRAHLAPAFLRRILARYEGTRLGRQELHAELLEDTPGALWTLDLLEANRVPVAPELVRLAVAIDPQGADPQKGDAEDDDPNAETGIIAGGIAGNGDGYVVADASGHYSPGGWGERAVLLHDELQADRIVAEDNFGGPMVESVIVTAAEKLYREGKRPSPHIAVTRVHASRGKQVRAEPIAALDEQHRIHHVGYFGGLEPQMTTWVPGMKSPDRMDARVWLFTYLMLDGAVADADGWVDLFQSAGVLSR